MADACPFVAFEDERDERSTRPDHRHRCYAELRPAPRALAHQEAYCLSPSFAACPTFQDWARREAARARPMARAPETRADGVPPYDAGYGRHQSDWTAPPPWAPTDASDATARAGTVPSTDGPELAAGSRPSTGTTGPEAGAVTAAAAAGAAADASRSGGPTATAAPSFLTARDRSPASEGAGLAASPARAAAGLPSEPDDEDDLVPAPRPAGRSSAGGGAAAADAGSTARGRREGESTGGSRAVRGPSWEQPRRFEAYPTLRTRVGLPGVPRIALGFIALAVAAVALFFLPTLVLRPGGGGTGGGGATATPSSSAAASASIAPTPVPAPTPQVYVIVSGDTLSRVAARYGLSLPELLAANPSIKNPDKVAIGDRIVIPTAAPSDVIDAGSPSPSPSG